MFFTSKNPSFINKHKRCNSSIFIRRKSEGVTKSIFLICDSSNTVFMNRPNRKPKPHLEHARKEVVNATIEALLESL